MFTFVVGYFNARKIIKAINFLKRHGLKAFLHKVRFKLFPADYSLWVKLYDVLRKEDKIRIKKHIENLSYKPTFSIITPVYNTPEKYLSRAIDSVIGQLYPHWELCIADDGSTRAHVKKILTEYQQKDSRIKVTFRNTNGGISEASNTALHMATGEFIVLMDHDDEIPEHALYMVALELNKYPQADIIYSDEDKIDENGNRKEPYFKSDWNYELFMGQNLISHLGVYRASLVRKVGGFRKGYEGAQDWDLAMRIVEITSPEKIRHIPHILYHWRVNLGSTALSINQKPYVREAQYKAIKDHFDRHNIPVTLENIVDGNHWRVRYPLPQVLPLVSIIIPTKNKKHILEKCLNSVLQKTTYTPYEIIIVDNGSDEPATIEFLEELSKIEQIKVIYYPVPFNFSRINNHALKHARGSVLLFLNNDTEVISPDWLEEMVSHIVKPEVGAVGAKLYYPNDTIQHAGVILGIGDVAGHAFRHFERNSTGYFARTMLTQELSAVTGACLMVKREVFEEVGGFDEQLAVAFNDVDLCIKIRQKGYKIIWTPFAQLYHHEGISGSRDTVDNPRFQKEIKLMQQKWGNLLMNDPAYNPNLTLDAEDFSLAFPPRVKKPWEEVSL